MRRFSLDELPQLVNVLKGDMSLVGPRPPLKHEVAQYDDDMARRLRVRPGMTGLWQVSGRSDLAWSEAIRLDLYYVDNWSMLQDLTILARTFGAVFGKHGRLLSRRAPSADLRLPVLCPDKSARPLQLRSEIPVTLTAPAS